MRKLLVRVLNPDHHPPEFIEKNHQSYPSRRDVIKMALGASVLALPVAGYINRRSVFEFFKEPTKRVITTPLPKDESVYTRSSEIKTSTLVPTLFETPEEYRESIETIQSCRDIDELHGQLQGNVFSIFGSHIAFGKSDQEDKWKVFAKRRYERLTGLPATKVPNSQIDTHYEPLDFLTAQFASERTCLFASVVPLSILKSLNVSENAFVKNPRVSGPIGGSEKINNGLTDLDHNAVLVDCYERGEPRKGVGKQWLYQLAFLVDKTMSRTSTTHNDIEFARLMPELSNTSQRQLDYADEKDFEILSIASKKAELILEILTGQLILPGDKTFGQPKQMQQELLLRRLYGVWPELPTHYFSEVAKFVRIHKRTPHCSSELV